MPNKINFSWRTPAQHPNDCARVFTCIWMLLSALAMNPIHLVASSSCEILKSLRCRQSPSHKSASASASPTTQTQATQQINEYHAQHPHHKQEQHQQQQHDRPKTMQERDKRQLGGLWCFTE
uniref:Uncharacterized protein n=1 Tax=Craspedostauros australis TaxID=1486917 RepID=A0A7R9WYK1_9STRA|mmetsp:Transcript_3868/g.10253  ORF Transcript_3868/g.10253 Transcript_3868/m.10253 type:complete len:122 (+) Transcript_3868:319-684(+)